MDSCMTSGIELFLLPSAAAADNFHNTEWIPSLQPQINFPRYVHLLSHPPNLKLPTLQSHWKTGKLSLYKCLIFLIVLITMYF